MKNPIPARWLVLLVFGLFSALNYLDRQILAALSPELKAVFGKSYQDIGWVHSAFYAVYAVCSPFAGLFIDRVGLVKGASISILLWSVAAAATGFVDTFAGLVFCRMLLGAAEAGGIPAFGKAAATYMQPQERALGNAVNQLGLSFGSMMAPFLAGIGWRGAFGVAGGLGLLWLPLLKLSSRAATAAEIPKSVVVPATPGEMLRDPKLWALIVGNILVMTVYSLWTNWTTIFLVKQFHLQQQEANQNYAWIPPIWATIGAFFGGWLSMRMMRAGVPLLVARSRAILTGVICLLATVLVPAMPDPRLATAMVSFSFFWSVAVSTNLYALPQDLFGPGRTAFAVSGITFGYGLMLVGFSPLVGKLVDQVGFVPVCQIAALLPLCGWLLLRFTALREAGN